MIIEVNIANNRPTVKGKPLIVCKNKNYKIKFNFDEEWEKHPSKTVRYVWRSAGKMFWEDVNFSGDIVEVPELEQTSALYIGVYAGDLQTTTSAQIDCAYSVLCDSVGGEQAVHPELIRYILCIPQDLTPEEKDQARKNIDAVSAEKFSEFEANVGDVFSSISAALALTVTYEKQNLSEDKKARARTNIGVAFSHNFTTVNATSTDSSDYAALEYVEKNFGKEPMDIFVMGYPVVKYDLKNKRLCTFYNDNSMYVFQWEKSAAETKCKLTNVGRVTNAEQDYVDAKVVELETSIGEVKTSFDETLDSMIVVGYTDTVTWDGNTDGLTEAFDPEWTVDKYYRVSSAAPHMGNSTSASALFLQRESGGTYTEQQLKFDIVQQQVPGAILFHYDDYDSDCYVVAINKEAVGKAIKFGYSSIVFPKSGTYFYKGRSGVVQSFTTPRYTGYGEQLNPRLLPEKVFTIDEHPLSEDQQAQARAKLGLTDYVLEEGKSDNGWEYRKWSSGKAECWKNVTATVKTTDWKDSGMMSFMSYGLFWTSGISIELQYPFAFTEHPVETALLSNGTAWLPLTLISTTHLQTDKTDSYRLCTYKVPDKDINAKIAFNVVGRWK